MLIDGDRLTDLMFEYGLGVSTLNTYAVKRTLPRRDKLTVEFMIRTDDLWKFCELARSKKPPEGKQWNAYLTIKDVTGRFSAGGICAEYPVNTVHAGKVQIPLECLEEVIRECGSNWAEVRCEDGRIAFGTNVCCHDSIALECGIENYEQYPTPLELILLGRLCDEKTRKDVGAGLETRIPAAVARLDSEIWGTVGSLSRYGVTEQDIKYVVEKALQRAEPAMRAGRYSGLIESGTQSQEDGSANQDGIESLRALDELFQVAGQFSKRSEYADLLHFIARFRLYSPFNAMLVHTQMPGATYVATARRWLQDYERRIHPGARPITILQPKGPVLFVFDVSDTSPLPDAPELPQSVTNPFAIFKGKENGELDRTIENAKRDGVRVLEIKFGSQHAGQIQTANSSDMFHLSEGPKSKERHVSVPVRYELLLNSNQTSEERYATLIHELGHLYCGHLGSPNEKHWPDRSSLSKEGMECEAESISYLVCARQGIETPSAEYIAGYLSEKGKMPQISVDAVVKIAGLIQQMGKSKMPLRKDNEE
jgi:hypothetical protein